MLAPTIPLDSRCIRRRARPYGDGLCAGYKGTGRPGYAPGDLLKLYIYGYLNRVRSSRRLEAECHRNMEVIWLMGCLKPDFKTIADFRCENRAAFKKVFREFVILCRRLDLFGRELLAVDSTRARFPTSKKSMSWPTRVILELRTLRLARKRGSSPMCQSHTWTRSGKRFLP
jgi:hypothetical protein